MSALRRIGHKGADLIVPGNTPASFDAALAHGVDMIEFDVLPEHQHDAGTGRLLLAHDYEHVDGAPTLEEGLAHLAPQPVRRPRARRRPQAPRLRGARGRRAARARPVERTLISSNWMRSLVVLRALEPKLRLGWSVPRLRKRDPTTDVADEAPGLRGRRLCAAKLPSAVKSTWPRAAATR